MKFGNTIIQKYYMTHDFLSNISTTYIYCVFVFLKYLFTRSDNPLTALHHHPKIYRLYTLFDKITAFVQNSELFLHSYFIYRYTYIYCQFKLPTQTK